MKFCKDCRYFRDRKVVQVCTHPNQGYDIVTGELALQHCRVNRGFEDRCGEAALWFEPDSPPSKPPLWKKL